MRRVKIELLPRAAKRSAGVDKKLNFFNTPRRTGQMALYVEQSHIKSPLKNTAIVTRPINNAITLIRLKKVTRPIEQPMKFEFIINLQAAKQIGVPIPQWTLMKADRVIQ